MLLPPSFTGRISPKAARVADIDALAPTAARSLQMLDRMNQRGYSVAELNQTYLHLIGFWRAMLDAGIYVNVAVPPATPNGVSLLRCSVCAVHTKEQLEHMIEVMAGIGRQLGVLDDRTLRVVGGAR